MDMRRGKRNRSEMSNGGKVGVEEEMKKWQQVADMIGGTLDDVCNMAEGERSELVLLISAEKSRKDNIDQAKNDDEDVLLASSDSEDDLYKKADVHAHTKAEERQASAEPSLKKVKVMIERSDVELVDLTSLSNDSGQSSSFNSSPVQNSKNSTATLDDDETEIKSPIFKKRLKSNAMGLTVNEREENYKIYERKCLNAIFQKVLPAFSNKKLNDANFLNSTLQPIISNTEYFEAMDKNPQKYKLDKQVPGSVSLEKIASATLDGICKGFEGIKFIKSQAVCTGKEGPGLVPVATDSSVRAGLSALKLKRRRELESGSRHQEGSVRNEGTRFNRTTRNSINASSDYFDDMFDTGAHDSADDFEVEDIDYLDEIELNKKGKAKSKRSRIIKLDSDDDFKEDDKDVKTGKKTKNPTSGTRRSPPGLGGSKLGGNDKRKATRGRGKGKVDENNVKDGSQTSMLNFVDSKRIGNLNANENLGSYDPMSHLVKLGGDITITKVTFGVERSKTSSVVENNQDSMQHSANFGAARSDDPSRMKYRNDQQSSRGKLGAGRSRTLTTVERKKTNEDPFKGKTGICPLCLKVQWKDKLEKHAAECSGDAQGTGTRELCPGCLELIPAEAFKDHSLGCNTD